MVKRILLKTKPSLDYSNNRQREMTVAEWEFAKKLYNDFEIYFNDKIKNLKYNDVADVLVHNLMCSFEACNDGYIDFIYGDEQQQGVAIFLSIGNKDNKPYVCTNFDVFIKGLDYEYNWDIDVSDDEIEIL